MDSKILIGSVGGFPIRGGLVSVSAGDTAQAFTAASGLVKTLFNVGGGLVLGVGLLAELVGIIFIQNEWENRKEHIKKAEEFKKWLREALSIDALSMVRTDQQMFFGICANKKLKFVCEGEMISVPTTMVKLISQNEGSKIVTLFDGSSYTLDYKEQSCHVPILDFWTVSGRRQVRIASKFQFIKGAMPGDKAELVNSLQAFFSQKRENIASLIGDNSLQRILTECQINHSQAGLNCSGNSSDKAIGECRIKLETELKECDDQVAAAQERYESCRKDTARLILSSYPKLAGRPDAQRKFLREYFPGLELEDL